MLGHGEETPSRFELLSMVKKHSNLLGKTVIVADEDDTSDVELDHRFWHDMLDLYFVRGKDSRGRQDDDLVFFVRKLSYYGYGFNDGKEGVSPYFVRRWAHKLDDLIGESNVDVDWRRSFYLNLIAHTSFTVTVAICSHQDLRNHQAEQGIPLSPIYKVVKTVYASPSRVDFQLDSKKVLTETDHCYCVILNAHDGAAFPRVREVDECSSSDSSSLRIETNSAKTKNTKLTLFSGFVSYQMVRDAYDAGKSRFGNLLGHSPGKTDKLYMKGPGGRGEVEVAVSGVADQSQQDLGPFSPVISKTGFGIGSIVRKAASVASVAAKNAYAAASSTHSFDDEMVPLKCCLMSISLPWEQIAHDLLFKGTPPVTL
ncbi:uncharacterized protein LOC126604173 isoform X3 [Malus sylvestris]|uniref:uncharacterized protein isoform X3 n=1 Tax=Malus domestica TaxID=3750 RepID=UPI0010A9DF7C|nr:uncharacterized protein KIAA0930 homolog isoform X2 [Malus domestica]XP_050127276.1 uncharacterized protein LOC126604173 isoform X3 [Malus sylvestris]